MPAHLVACTADLASPRYIGQSLLRSGAVRSARLAHNQKVGGSNPSSRTQINIMVKRKTNEEFLLELETKGIPYVPLQDYSTSKTKITFLCPEDHEFEASPNNVLKGRGCPTCRLSKLSKLHRKPLDKYISDLRAHGNNDEVVGTYINQRTKLLHRCKKSGHLYEAFPGNLDRGLQSCPFCNPDSNIEHILYYIKIGIYYKVGITRRTVMERFRLENKPIKILLTKSFASRIEAKAAEKEILDQYKPFLVGSINYLKSGNTELFAWDVLQLDNNV